MNHADLARFIQNQFTDGLALVVGSGLSAAEGMPGMPGLAQRLVAASGSVPESEIDAWSGIAAALESGSGLESALHQQSPTPILESWIVRETVAFLVPREKKILESALRGDRELRLATFLSRILKSPEGLPILTTNYDRLIEMACELAGFHVDSTAIGQYAGAFDHQRSFMGSCRGIKVRARKPVLDYFPRAVVLKPHGSFDWYKFENSARRCSIDLSIEPLIITPGINKYRAGYESPFDEHRELANKYIRQADRLLVVGYGFNDDHLQTHLEKRIEEGVLTLILNRSITTRIENIVKVSPGCVCLSSVNAGEGTISTTKDGQSEFKGKEWWDLGILAKEMLA